MLNILAEGGMLSFFSFFYLFFLSSFLSILGAVCEIGVNSGRLKQVQAVQLLLFVC
jgi:hypothetical protein